MQDDLEEPIPLGASSAPEPSDPQNDVTAPAAPPLTAPPTEAEKQAAFAKFQASDISVVGEILDRMRKYPFLGTPYDLDIRIVPIDGTSRAPLGRIPFSDLLDTPISPPDKLLELITDLYHLPTARSQRSYDVIVLWRRTGRVYARFRVDLPSPDAIRATRNAEANAQQRAMPPPPAVGGPPPYYAPSPPPARYGSPPGGLGAAPAGLPTDQALLIGALQEALTAIREGRGPQAVAAPPPDPIHQLIEQMRAEIAELKAQRSAPAPQAVAAPPPPPPSAMEQFVRSGSDKMMMAVLKLASGAFEKAITAGLGGVPADVVDAVEEPPPPAPAPPPEPAEPPPFQTIPVSKWADGREVLYARDNETGDPHWMGIALGNPILIEKAMAIGESLAQPIIAAVQRKFNTLGETPVREAPPAAAPPPPQRAPPQAAPAAAAAPPPPPPAPAAPPDSAWPSI